MEKVVYVDWMDSGSTRGWCDVDKSGAVPIKSVGYLIHKDQKCIVITTSISKSGSVMDQLTIPRSCITKLRNG